MNVVHSKLEDLHMCAQGRSGLPDTGWLSWVNVDVAVWGTSVLRDLRAT
jgi:hypothetical protein